MAHCKREYCLSYLHNTTSLVHMREQRTSIQRDGPNPTAMQFYINDT